MRGGRCRAHQLAKTRPGSTSAWRRVRAQVLKRDGYRCRLCGAPATHVDHIVPVREGGTDEPVNLPALCERCNLFRG